MKRLGIFVFFDPQGVVGDYVVYLIKGIRPFFSHLKIVVNGEINAAGREQLEPLADDFYCRENVGLEVGGYLDAIKKVTWSGLEAYDEVICFNDTVYGPVYPFEEMFTAMEQRSELDFWGITKHYGAPFDPFGTIECGYIPEHIQSTFLAFRKRLFTSAEFQAHWEKLAEVRRYQESIGWHEAIFTEKFTALGYKGDVYVDTEDLRVYTEYPLFMSLTELLKNRRCPIVKRKGFYWDYSYTLEQSAGSEMREAYDYLRYHTSYDTNMIWQDLLRLQHLALLKEQFQLNYILPERTLLADTPISEKLKLAVVCHIHYADEVDNCFKYLPNLPANTRWMIATTTEETRQVIEERCRKFGVWDRTDLQIMTNRGRCLSASLVIWREKLQEFDYVCIVHDKKVKQLKPFNVGAAFRYRCYENLLGSTELVENILETFESEPRLGLLVPPPPNHSAYYSTMCNGGWGGEQEGNFEATQKLCERLGISVKMSPEIQVIAPLGVMFWARPAALKTLLDYPWSYEDFPAEPIRDDGTILHALERVYPFVAQAEGYYTGWVFADKTAAMEITNLYYMTKELMEPVYLAYLPEDFRNIVHLQKNYMYSWKQLDAQIQDNIKYFRTQCEYLTSQNDYLKVNSEYLQQNCDYLTNHNEYLTANTEYYRRLAAGSTNGAGLAECPAVPPALVADHRRLQEMLEELQSSRIWRWSKPYRKIMDRLRKIAKPATESDPKEG